MTFVGDLKVSLILAVGTEFWETGNTWDMACS